MMNFSQNRRHGKAVSGVRTPVLSGLIRGDRPALIFFAVALALGGAGVAYPLLTWIVTLLALAAGGIVLSRHGWSGLAPLAKAAIGLAGAFWLLLALQIMPLPFSVWASLPGHEIAVSVAQTAGIRAWQAWSLAPGRTLPLVLTVLPPLAAMLLVAAAPTKRRIAILRLIVAMALINALLGVTQFGAGAAAAPIFYGTTHRGVAVGLFVNRNHTAVFLMVAMLLAVLPGVVRLAGRDEGSAVQGLRSLLVAALAIGVLATLSRSGVFLLPVAVAGAYLLARSRQLRIRSVVLAALVCVAGMAALAQTPLAGALARRYASAAEDARFNYWANTWSAAKDAFPLGTGYGTFEQVYQTYEPLNQITKSIVNRAHNDFLEVLMVGGIGGCLLIVGAIGLVVFGVVTARRVAASRFERRVPLASALGLFLIGAGSIFDYPLHGVAMAVVAGGLLGLLGINVRERSGAGGNDGAGTKARKSVNGTALSSRAAASLYTMLAVLGLGTSAVCWSQHLVRAGRPDLAVGIQPWDPDAWSALANQRQIAGDAPGSSEAARHALALNLLDATALRAEGAARLQQGQGDAGAALLSLGARLGWRDAFTQVWLVEQALGAGAANFAVQRIDALLRTETLFNQMIALLPPMLAQQPGREALAEQLGFDPGWRAAFFNAAARSGTYQLGDLEALLSQLRRSAAPPRPGETALIRAVLGDAGRFADARQLWLASGGKGDLADPGFEGQHDYAVATGPYVWQAGNLAGVKVRAERAAAPLKGNAVAVSSSGLASGAALMQTLALAPGRYQVGLKVLARDRALARRLTLRLECLGATASSAASGEAADDGAVKLTWKDAGGGVQVARGIAQASPRCTGQRLQIVVPDQESGPYSLWIDDVELAAIK